MRLYAERCSAALPLYSPRCSAIPTSQEGSEGGKISVLSSLNAAIVFPKMTSGSKGGCQRERGGGLDGNWVTERCCCQVSGDGREAGAGSPAG